MHLRDLTPEQKKSGLAAWLGWMFDGLDMHIYTLVSTLFVAILVFHPEMDSAFQKLDANRDGRIAAAEWVSDKPLASVDRNGDGAIDESEYAVFSGSTKTSSDEVKDRAGWIQASFLIGWAVGGAFFGRLGDLLGRARALSLTVLTYALFTGLSFFATEWWHLLIFRFLAALGIGGEWAVGSTLLAETWPKSWRPWTAAVLQTGVNIGVLIACGVGILLGGQHPKWIFLIGVAPALLVLWIRSHVPEPAAWSAAQTGEKKPGIADLFRGEVRSITIPCIGICAFSLTAWWAFMFWQSAHVRNLDVVKAMSGTDRDQLVAKGFALIIGISVIGNFVAGALAKRWGYKPALITMFSGFVVTMTAAFRFEHSVHALVNFWLPAVGFWSGVFGLFTMMLPPLFPTLLRTTGAGFCYNIGRIAAAVGTIYAAYITKGGDYRTTLLYDGFLFIPAIFFVFFLPLKEARDE
jgi:MFS family permease